MLIIRRPWPAGKGSAAGTGEVHPVHMDKHDVELSEIRLMIEYFLGIVK